MIREIIKPQSQNHTIKIPKDYLNREVEILIFPIGSVRPQSNYRDKLIKKTSGILSGRKIDPLLWQKETRSEWDNR